MANTSPTKLTIIEQLNLLVRFLFDISSFKEMERLDNLKREDQNRLHKLDRADVLRNALFKSFILITTAGISGLALGIYIRYHFPSPKSLIISSIQILSALLLLWATLALRGWDIQSYCGVTLTERINIFIFRSLYFVGTFLLIITMVWTV